MRHSEFWARMDQHLGSNYARTWAARTQLADLDHRTPSDALEAGESPLLVWRAVHTALGLAPSER